MTAIAGVRNDTIQIAAAITDPMAGTMIGTTTEGDGMTIDASCSTATGMIGTMMTGGGIVGMEMTAGTSTARIATTATIIAIGSAGTTSLMAIDIMYGIAARDCLLRITPRDTSCMITARIG